MRELLEKYNYNLVRLKKLPDTRELYKSKVKRENTDLEEFKHKIELIQEARIVFQKTIDDFYEESIGQLENLINYALKVIFFDKQYQIKIEVSNEDKKEKSFSFEILNLLTGCAEDLRDASGAGIRAVISFVILSYYLTRFNSPYIFADELYSQISAEYIPGFFEFVHRLCEEQGLIFILITHDPRITPYADQVIHVAEGRINVIKEIDDDLVKRLTEQINR